MKYYYKLKFTYPDYNNYIDFGSITFDTFEEAIGRAKSMIIDYYEGGDDKFDSIEKYVPEQYVKFTKEENEILKSMEKNSEKTYKLVGDLEEARSELLKARRELTAIDTEKSKLFGLLNEQGLKELNTRFDKAKIKAEKHTKKVLNIEDKIKKLGFEVD